MRFRPFTTLLSGAALLGVLAAPAFAQAVYHIEKDPPRTYYNLLKTADRGYKQVEPLTGFYNDLLDEDLDFHCFGWKDGYYTTDGQPTFTAQMSIHRIPRRFERIPVVNVSDDVLIARYARNPEWRIPMVKATFYVYPIHANPAVDTPLAVVASTNRDENFRSRAIKMPWRKFLVKAVIDHAGVERQRRVAFTRTYQFRTPTIALEDGRHEPYEVYHWFW